MGAEGADLVREFWRLMATNDFGPVGAVLGDDFVLEWPQSGERIRGRANFAAMNEEYPAAGPWTFTVERIMAAGREAVSVVLVSDGTRSDRAISFFSFANGKIASIVEYWPEPFAPPANRGHLVEIMDSLA